MNELTYEILFSNGFRLMNLRLNGNNYISNSEIKKDLIETGLSTVIITDSNGDKTVMKDVELVQIAEYSDGWYLVLRELSENEKKEKDTATELTNLQIALAEVYEMVLM